MGGREREREEHVGGEERERGAVGGEWRHLEEKREGQLEGRETVEWDMLTLLNSPNPLKILSCLSMDECKG